MPARPRQPFGINLPLTATALAACLLGTAVLTAGCSSGPAAARRPVTASGPRSVGVGAPLPHGADIRAENALPGYPGWRITRAGRGGAIEGFADRTSALPGTPVRLFVSTTAASFRVRALRFGWYGGALARLVWTSAVVAGHRQPPAVVRPHGMVVAPWRPALTLPTTGWPPGSYLLRLDTSSGVQRYVPLVIRSPSVAGRVVLVQPATTFQAYNTWGGYDLYQGPDGRWASRARVVSFDRPYASGDGAGEFFEDDQPLLAYAERLGLPLAYVTSIDLDLNQHVADGARAIVSEAHDEYWSVRMRATVTRARDRGVNIAFFGANAIFRKTRFASSPLGPDRVEINYKNALEDPLYGINNELVTGSWPSPPDADPESSLTGQAYACATPRAPFAPMVVTEPRGWIWAGSGARRGTMLPSLVGPEFDRLDLAGPTPRPIEVFASSPEHCRGQAVTSDVTYYVAASGAGVFDAGTVGWICALSAVAIPDSFCPPRPPPAPARRIIQAATRNILAAFARGRAGGGPPPVTS